MNQNEPIIGTILFIIVGIGWAVIYYWKWDIYREKPTKREKEYNPQTNELVGIRPISEEEPEEK